MFRRCLTAKMGLMVLARAWRRRLYASLGLTVIVPVALLACLTVLALSGGVPGLGFLRQAVSGPSGPGVSPPVLGAPGAVLSSGSFGGAPAGTAASAVSSPASVSANSGSGAGARGGLPGSSVPAGSPRAGHRGAGGAGGGGYAGPPQSSSGQPSRTPTAVDRVLRTVTPITSTLPAPLGPALTRTLKSGGSLADRVLHQLPGQ